MRKNQSILFLIISFLLLNACAPFWRYEYYAPDGEGGKVGKRWCAGTVGPPEKIYFSYDGVDLYLLVIETADGIVLEIDLFVPQGKVILFADHSFIVQLCDGNKELFSNTTIPKCNIGGSAKICDIENNLVGGTIKKPYRPSIFSKLKMIDASQLYFLHADIHMPKSKCFDVTFPKFQINDKSIVLPIIHFKKDRYIEYFMPLNC